MTNISAEALATLRANPDVQRLVLALTLAEGFDFHIVTCETPRDADAVIEVIRLDVHRSESVPVSIVKLPPENESIAITNRSDLVISILEPLTSPTIKVANNRVMILDATRARYEDTDHWIWLFQRLNEKRNSIAEALKCPFILIAPENLKIQFTRHAPDFWSIRSVNITVDALPIASNDGQQWNAGHALADLHSREQTQILNIEELESLVHAARRRVLAQPTRDENKLYLAAVLRSYSSYLFKSGNFSLTITMAKELVELNTYFIKRFSTDLEPKLNCIESYRLLANAYAAEGATNDAIDNYEKGMLISHDVVSGIQDRSEGVIILLSICSDYVSFLFSREDYEKALDTCMFAINQNYISKFVKDFENNVELTRRYFRLMGVAASIMILTGDWKRGSEMFEEAIQIQKKIIRVTDESGEAITLSKLLQVFGEMLAAEGNIRAAERRFHEALSLVEDLGHHQYNEEVRREAAAIYQDLGQLYLSIQNIEEARRYLLLATQQLESMAGDVNFKTAMSVLASIYTQLSDLEITQSSLDKAEEYARRALDLAEKLRNTEAGSNINDPKILNELKNIYAKLAEILTLKGNPAEAQLYQQKAADLDQQPGT